VACWTVLVRRMAERVGLSARAGWSAGRSGQRVRHLASDAGAVTADVEDVRARVGLWLNFLLAVDRSWDTATEDDAEHFKEWRLTDQSNPRPVETSTFAGDLAALRSFYRWAARTYGIADPGRGNR
jgi:Phage integrase, N-terminal SAM-like domain